MSGLGRLERVDLRGVWPDEARDFTPWLAQAENLGVLAEALGYPSDDLELESVERGVGPFRADIVCRDPADDSRVLIENQLEATDHRHLGQLLTYAAGLEAVTLVWVAARFTEEHRAAVDWLNGVTGDHVRFFALEVELWRIGDSQPAPRFNIAAKPNEWTRRLAARAKEMKGGLSPLQSLQLDYWTAFMDVLKGPNIRPVAPQPQMHMRFAIGRSGFALFGVMVAKDRRIRADLYISGDAAKAWFHRLFAERAVIDAEFGEALDWQELPTGRDCRICVAVDADPTAEADWPRQHAWLAERLEKLSRVFRDRVRALPSADDLLSGDATDPMDGTEAEA